MLHSAGSSIPKLVDPSVHDDADDDANDMAIIREVLLPLPMQSCASAQINSQGTHSPRILFGSPCACVRFCSWKCRGGQYGVQQLVRSFEESKKAEMFRGQTHRRLEKLKADKLYVSCLLRVRCTRLLPPAHSRFTPACCALAPCSFPYACASFSVFSRVRACLCGCAHRTPTGAMEHASGAA
jgi:hypothetical protein